MLTELARRPNQAELIASVRQQVCAAGNGCCFGGDVMKAAAAAASVVSKVRRTRVELAAERGAPICRSVDVTASREAACD